MIEPEDGRGSGGKGGFFYRHFFEFLKVNFNTYTGFIRNRHSAILFINREFRDDYILFIIAFACGNIAMKREVWERGKGDITSAGDSGLIHTAVPDRDAHGSAVIVNFDCLGISTSATGFDIDIFAGSESQCNFCIGKIADTFIESNSGF